MAERSFTNSRYARKRASCDSNKPFYSHISSHDSNLQKLAFKQIKPKSSRKQAKQIAELTLTMDMLNHNPKKNNLSLYSNVNSKNQTHRVNPAHKESHKNICKDANLSELREQVEQLRMQNQNLKEQLKNIKNNEKQWKYQLMRLQQSKYSLQKKYEIQIESLQNRLEKYTLKIRELYEQLIQEKQKKVDAHPYDIRLQDVSNFQETNKLNMHMSPNSSEIGNINYFKSLENQGQKQYYASIKQFSNINSYQNQNWSFQNSHMSSAQASRKIGGVY